MITDFSFKDIVDVTGSSVVEMAVVSFGSTSVGSLQHTFGYIFPSPHCWVLRNLKNPVVIGFSEFTKCIRGPHFKRLTQWKAGSHGAVPNCSGIYLHLNVWQNKQIVFLLLILLWLEIRSGQQTLGSFSLFWPQTIVFRYCRVEWRSS